MNAHERKTLQRIRQYFEQLASVDIAETAWLSVVRLAGAALQVTWPEDVPPAVALGALVAAENALPKPDGHAHVPWCSACGHPVLVHDQGTCLIEGGCHFNCRPE